MKRNRNVKIVATLGPSSSDAQTIRALFMAGADVFRLNMSHGSHQEIAARHALVRELERDTGQPIAILADLQGPKLRLGRFAEGAAELAEGAAFRLDLDPAPGNARRVCMPHPEIFSALKPGAALLINDGKLRLTVQGCSAEHADCQVVVGGVISDRKGVNVPDVVLPVRALSEKDRTDLEFACGLGVDWVALSFVQRAADVEEARTLIAGRAAIMAKIEKPAALNEIDAILAASDGLMVARGDLGVEMPVQAVPPIQKRLVRQARAAAKPVIVATQMLESMIESPMPTRAEVSDVATAIYEGADAIMLSAESAAGAYPVEAVQTMHNVALSVESDQTWREVINASRRIAHTSVADGIVAAAREIAETTDIKAICCFTESGSTAGKVARERPQVPIIALSPNPATLRRLCLTWGTHCVLTGQIKRFKSAVVSAAQGARALGIADKHDQIVVTAGVPFNVPGTTNILRVAPCDERLIYSAETE
ncbi:MAG: pyruvate kinase [Pararhodobacter sp.]|nr:pyruvate kinase [Pararhodobacter sp.]